MIYDIIVIGAGPSGLTAAIYGKRANKNVLVLEAKTYGGQIINTLDIENYPVLPSLTPSSWTGLGSIIQKIIIINTYNIVVRFDVSL